MKQHLVSYLHKLFGRLLDVYGFKVRNELNIGQDYAVEFVTNSFVIKIEKYRCELYVTTYKEVDDDKEINLFNLLEYLRRGSAATIRSNYFREEGNVETRFKKQLDYVTSVFRENYDLIASFYSDANYYDEVDKFEKYWKKKHPELY